MLLKTLEGGSVYQYKHTSSHGNDNTGGSGLGGCIGGLGGSGGAWLQVHRLPAGPVSVLEEISSSVVPANARGHAEASGNPNAGVTPRR